ncbi:MAG: hypothetical protein IJW64_07130 [Clostridia bacterium]|nr:hypothetical protein [Clostridia bacterium]
MLLNITNGDYLNSKLSKENEGEFFPFREAMMQGETTPVVLNDEFIKTRAKSLNVSQDLYIQNARDLINFADSHFNYSKLKLWFGKDSFCQLNLLTLLALLEQINYRGDIELALIDDESGEVLQSEISVKLGGYKSIYKTTLIDRQMIAELGVIEKRAIEFYFDYLSPNGKLANLVKQNANLSQEELIILLLNNSAEYGLSDILAKELITQIKN